MILAEGQLPTLTTTYFNQTVQNGRKTFHAISFFFLQGAIRGNRGNLNDIARSNGDRFPLGCEARKRGEENEGA